MALPEVMEYPIPVLLVHLGMNIEAGIAQLSDLLGQQLHTLGGITEDNRLVDLQLIERERLG